MKSLLIQLLGGITPADHAKSLASAFSSHEERIRALEGLRAREIERARQKGVEIGWKRGSDHRDTLEVLLAEAREQLDAINCTNASRN